MRLQLRYVGLGLCFLIYFITYVPASRLAAETLKNPPLVFTGSDPRDMNVGDFNGDGKQDIAYLDGQFPSALHILLGNGDGTFQHGQSIPLPQGIGGSITIADVNADGHPDILIGGGNQFQPELAVFLGVGDGTFSAPIISQFGATFTSFAFINFRFGVADFNGDGSPDLAVTDGGNQLIFILLGDKTGSFTLKSTISNSSAPVQVITGDFNGDGHPDFLARGVLGQNVSVYLGNGDGTFQPGVSYTGPNHIGSVVLADMDGDGHPDMVVVGFGNVISILHGNPDGTFAATSSGDTTLAGSLFSVIGVQDFNGDGILDIAILSEDGIGILLGQGSLTYSAPVYFMIGPTQPIVTALADFNQDAHLGFAATAPGGIVLLKGVGDGTFLSVDTYLVPGLAGFVGFGVADFNGDHIPDIVAPVSPSGARMLLGAGAGKFNLSPTVVPTAPGSSLGLPNTFRSLLIPGNFNSDIAKDILFVNSNSVLFGNGDGTFSVPLDLSLTLPGLSIAGTADFNHDGLGDMLGFGPFNLSLHSILGQPGNSFRDLLLSFPFPLATGGPTAFADFNHDGIVDVVFGSFPDLQPMLGNGDGTFRLVPTVPAVLPGVVPTGINEVAAVDLDGDGNIDIVASMSFVPTLEIFYGKGDGTFEPPVRLLLSRPATQLAIADMNADGKPDLVLTDQGVTNRPGILFVIHNNGARSFGPEVHYLAGNVHTMAVQDLNGDGLPDIVIGTGADAASILLNQPGLSTLNGTFTVTPEPSAFGQPVSTTLVLASTLATGSVNFSIDGSPIADVPLISGAATFTLPDSSTFILGDHTVTATYSGDATFTPAVFPQPHKIVPVIHPTSIALTASPNPSVASQTVHFTFTVTSAGPTPAGSVAIHDGVVNIASVALDPATGAGIFNTALLSPGTHSITAVYAGDVNSAPATSAPVSVVVTAFPTTTTLAFLPATPQPGSSFALSTTVASTAGTPTGTVSFFDGTTLLGARELDSKGIAVFVSTFSAPGTHSFTASYNANGPFAASTSSPQSLSSVGFPLISSTLQLSISQNTAQNRLLFTAKVQPGSVLQRQTVAFFSDNLVLGEAPLDSTGTATFEVAGIFPGTHYFSAVFAGSNVLAGSVATTLLGSHISSSPEFSLHLSTANAILSGTQPIRIEVLADPLNGFTGSLSLSCSTIASVRCSFQPASLSAGGNSVLSLAFSSSDAGHTIASFNPRYLFPGLTIALVLFLVSVRTGRNRRLVFATLGVAVFAAAIGCAGRPEPVNQPFTITITATSSQAGTPILHSVDLRVVIAK